MISRNKKHELSGLMEVSTLWWSGDRSWKSLVLFINSRSLDSHIKCLKLREMYLTMINCATNTNGNEDFLDGLDDTSHASLTGIQLKLCLPKFNIFQMWFRGIRGQAQFGLLFPLTPSPSSLKSKVPIWYSIMLHCTGLGRTILYHGQGYFLWKLRRSRNLGLTT